MEEVTLWKPLDDIAIADIKGKRIKGPPEYDILVEKFTRRVTRVTIKNFQIIFIATRPSASARIPLSRFSRNAFNRLAWNPRKISPDPLRSSAKQTGDEETVSDL